MAAHFKKAAETAAHIIALDETGVMMRPLVRRSLAPRGKPLVIKYKSNHRQKVSVQGAVVIGPDGKARGLRTTMHEDAYVDGQATARFLQRLLREFDGPLMLIWDRGNMHKGPHVREVLAQNPRLTAIELPPYCPDLNPIEWVWSWIKYAKLANYCPHTLRQLVSTLARTIVETAENLTLLDNLLRAAGMPATVEIERGLAA